MNSKALRWTLLVLAVLAIILVPFMLFGDQIDAWTEGFLETARRSWVTVAVLSGLLMVDILAPIPSSLVSTASGYLLGFFEGLAASAIGMTVSCIAGYWLAATFGHPVANRIVGEDELERLKELSLRLGDWVIIICRPVPMLAEASVIFAGLSHTPLPRFLLLTTLSNIAISAVYAAVGAFSASVNSFLLAFFGSILIPAIAMLIMRRKPSQAKTRLEPKDSA
jgi:uncharacterized membrane protein YdjX (TVP38/TMEM64 family)